VPRPVGGESSRLTKRPDLLAPYGVRSPLWSGHTVVLNPALIRTDEVMESAETSRYVSILGAAWLLMGQRNVSDVRVITDDTGSNRSGSASTTPSPISIVELRRREAGPRQSNSGGSGRTYHYQWTVEPFWRQQACGPGWSQRKSVYITSFEKGPKDKPFKSARVNPRSTLALDRRVCRPGSGPT
jgi:hypothetical protein